MTHPAASKKPQPKATAAAPKSASTSALDTARRVLRIESEAISALIDRLDSRFESAVDLLMNCQGRVVVTGMGKSGLIGRKISATFASTGTPSFFLHAAEAAHGDLGTLVGDDVVLAISTSGETRELLDLVETLRRLGTRLITLTANSKSPLAAASDIVLDIAVKEEACSLNLAPTASTAAALAMGDAMAIALLDRRGFNEEDFAALHPGGKLGKRLRRLDSLMHSGASLPSVTPDATVPEVIYEISRKALGLAAVVDANRKLLGVITDGDLRRLMEKRRKETFDLNARECMTKNPATLHRDEVGAAALKIMEERKITSVLVVDSEGRLEGVVHIHDLWAPQLF
jgi:arabinose-5-phosphate isomerase